MKRIILLPAFILSVVLAFGQGVNFEKLSFKEASPKLKPKKSISLSTVTPRGAVPASK